MFSGEVGMEKIGSLKAGGGGWGSCGPMPTFSLNISPSSETFLHIMCVFDPIYSLFSQKETTGVCRQ